MINKQNITLSLGGLIYAQILHRLLEAANPRGRNDMAQGNDDYFIGHFGDERLKKTVLYCSV